MSRDRYSLRQMVDMTGVSEFTLRGWETRYSAFAPERTETGRRRYTDKDLQKAILLRELVQRENRIGNIATLSLGKLRDLMEPAPGNFPEAEPVRTPEIRAILRHAALQEWSLLESSLRKSISRSEPLTAIRELVIPLLEAIGQEVANGRLSIASEHVLSALLKQHLHRLTEHHSTASGPRFVMATPEGDFHELGILVAHAIATQLRVRSLYLGPNTPKRELCETVTRLRATHLLIGATVTRKEGAAEDFYSFLHFLDQNIPRDVAFWLGGRGSQPVELKRPSVTFSSIAAFQEELENIAKAGKRHG